MEFEVCFHKQFGVSRPRICSFYKQIAESVLFVAVLQSSRDPVGILLNIVNISTHEVVESWLFRVQPPKTDEKQVPLIDFSRLV